MNPFLQQGALFGLGLLLGLKHALDADHVVALTTFVSQSKSLRKSSWLGVTWGLGHTLTLFVVSLLILVFKVTIPAQVALFFEFLVGILLVGLGANVIRKAINEEIHFHRHDHERGISHSHLHAHGHTATHDHSHASFLIGMVHGLAGSGALVLLVLATVETVLQGILFVLVFGVGSILGMLVTTTLIALPFKYAGKLDKIGGPVKVVAGLASIVVGIGLMYQIGVVDGLLL